MIQNVNSIKNNKLKEKKIVNLLVDLNKDWALLLGPAHSLLSLNKSVFYKINKAMT